MLKETLVQDNLNDLIRVGEEIREALPLQTPDLDPQRTRQFGDPSAEPVRVIFGQRVYAQTSEHARSEPDREIGGVLLGRAFRHEGACYVEVSESLRAPNTEAGATHVTFTDTSWQAMGQEGERRFPGLRIVGWYHTHPKMSIFVSSQDVFFHSHFFKEEWQVALVIEPHKHLAGFFIWRNGQLLPAAGFYERFDIERRSVISWKHQHAPVHRAPTLPPEFATAVAVDAATPAVQRRSWLMIGANVLLAATLLVATLSLLLVREQQAQVGTLQTAVAELREVDSTAAEALPAAAATVERANGQTLLLQTSVAQLQATVDTQAIVTATTVTAQPASSEVPSPAATTAGVSQGVLSLVSLRVASSEGAGGEPPPIITGQEITFIVTLAAAEFTVVEQLEIELRGPSSIEPIRIAVPDARGLTVGVEPHDVEVQATLNAPGTYEAVVLIRLTGQGELLPAGSKPQNTKLEVQAAAP
jgi:proteasome lid subunit RPN8/RPN11